MPTTSNILAFRVSIHYYQTKLYICVSDAWQSRWAESKHKSDYGQLKLSAGKFYGDAEADKGNSSVTKTKLSYHANVGKRGVSI